LPELFSVNLTIRFDLKPVSRHLDNSCYHDYIRIMQQTLGTIFLYAGLICWLAGLFGLVCLLPTFVVGMVQGALGGPYLFFWRDHYRDDHQRPAGLAATFRQAVRIALILFAVAAVVVLAISRSM